MSGHSHWAKVKRSKAVTDARRGREWSKIARKIIVAAKSGGGNPEENLTLRYCIDEARAANMPNDTIDKAIKKGTGELGAANYERMMYEGYGPGGVAFLVDVLTDNRSRTAPEMRNIFERCGGQLGATNCVAWMFQQKGTFLVPADKIEEDALMETALELGADDVRREGDVFEVTCPPAAYHGVREGLKHRKIEVLSSELGWSAANNVPVAGEKAQQIIRLMESLEEHEDVQGVYANFDIPDDILSDGKK
jgi:YebC/PmpR family DNA-binding regulatory protein